MGIQVAVAGASGYAGGELLRLLACHPGMTLGSVTAQAHAGEPVTWLHPHLTSLAGRQFEPTDPERLSQADLVFLALPHGQSAAVAAALPGHIKIVDLGADYRLADPAAWQRFYGGQHAGRWTYGLPELAGARAQIIGAGRVAVPGCFATAAILALSPLLASGLADPADIVIVAASGTSGAGRSPQPHLLGAEVMGAVSAYQVGGVHRHTPEIEQALAEVVREGRSAAARADLPHAASHPAPSAQLPAAGAVPPPPGRNVTVSFTPLLAPMPRGILATCTARLSAGLLSAGRPSAGRPKAGGSDAAGGSSAGEVTAMLRAVLIEAYANEPFVHVLPESSWPTTAATAGSNAAHLQVAADCRAGRAVVVAAIDNLGKGAAGQAIQNANLMSGLAETAGLTANGVSP
ncbi:MAG TPA: NAGSA dehydrogenase family protein [Streptosporangiaceae bacterium]|nr:NAGSA dehydrogenase family protein [Streptosporangiaceae bacterium]